jgi:hypothetical protein
MRSKTVLTLRDVSTDQSCVSIQVTEVKGLGSLLVGVVMCKSADFFMSRPQLMVVDITELGTVKLQLEVVWK